MAIQSNVHRCSEGLLYDLFMSYLYYNSKNSSEGTKIQCIISLLLSPASSLPPHPCIHPSTDLKTVFNILQVIDSPVSL